MKDAGKMEKVKERNLVIDVIRGIAVLAVLLAHSHQRGLYPEGILYPDDLLARLIYPWYMPIFVLVSGYVLHIGGGQTLWNKFKHLVYPTFIWSIVLWSIHDFEFVGIKWYFDFSAYSFGEYIRMLLLNPTYVVWFLWVIFICTIVLSICYTIVKKVTYDNMEGNELYVIVLASMCFVLISNFKFSYWFGIVGVSWYWIYFVAGYGLHSLGKKEYLFRLVGIEVIICIIIKILSNLGIVSMDNTTMDPWLGMGIVYLVSFQMIRYKDKKFMKQLVEMLSWLGKNSLPIYLFQLAFLNIGYGTGIIRIITIFVTATLFSVTMTVIVKKSKILSAILLGNF